MNIDIRKLICTTILTMNDKTKIISWDHIIKYIELLEKKYNTKINLIYEKEFDEDRYDKLIEVTAKNNNMYFILNQNFTTEDIEKLIDEKLLLSEKDTQLINLNIDNNITNQYLEQYKLNKILNKIPNDNLSFTGLFKLFMLRYSQKIDNKIDKNIFWETMFELKNILNQNKIEIDRYNKLELFRTTSGQYPTYQKYIITDKQIILEILDINKFYEELADKFNRQSFIFSVEIIDWIIDYKFIQNKESQKIQTLN